MLSNYRLKLFTALLVFAIVISFSIVTIDYFRMKDSIADVIHFQIEHASETAVNALHTIDKVYYLLDSDIDPMMEQHTETLQKKYLENPDLSTWNFVELADSFEMDVYLINEQNIIEYSNVPNEIGLDFSSCCKTLSETLHERRASGEMFIDGIDIDQQKGAMKKFSYMATPDKKYLIELGYELENEMMFAHFDFLEVVDEIVENSNFINKINVLNFGGNVYGQKQNDMVTDKRREAFELARKTKEMTEFTGMHEGEEVEFRYIPYMSIYDEGATQLKVVEIIYSKQAFATYFDDNFNTFLIQFFIILIVTALMSSLIASRLSKPIYYAFHDSLTGLKNRAAFNEYLDELLGEKKVDNIVLLMLDLDNFKLVNDHLGHTEGDNLLYNIGRKLSEVTKDKGMVFRLGGDEFAVICTMEQMNDERNVEQMATKIIDQLNMMLEKDDKINSLVVTVSIGITFAAEQTSKDDLFYQADCALYASKKKGKNQYQIYNESINFEAERIKS